MKERGRRKLSESFLLFSPKPQPTHTAPAHLPPPVIQASPIGCSSCYLAAPSIHQPDFKLSASVLFSIVMKAAVRSGGARFSATLLHAPGLAPNYVCYAQRTADLISYLEGADRWRALLVREGAFTWLFLEKGWRGGGQRSSWPAGQFSERRGINPFFLWVFNIYCCRSSVV